MGHEICRVLHGLFVLQPPGSSVSLAWGSLSWSLYLPKGVRRQVRNRDRLACIVRLVAYAQSLRGAGELTIVPVKKWSGC